MIVALTRLHSGYHALKDQIVTQTAADNAHPEKNIVRKPGVIGI